MMRSLFFTPLALGLTALSPTEATAKEVGFCRFDANSLSFAGTAVEQARCLLTPVLKWAKLGEPLSELPPTLASRVGKSNVVGFASLKRYLAAHALAVGDLDAPVSSVTGAGGVKTKARYFVIHDTSSPWYGNGAFPIDIDSAPRVNSLSGYLGANAVAHFFINRGGEIAMGHDFSVPWRATKFETRTTGLPVKGLFLHVENVQPRRRDPSGSAKNDATAPEPGLTAKQYERLALLYVVASARAGQWLIPAYHTVIDSGIADGHDDPQNFDLATFDAALAAVIGAVERP